MGVDERSHQKVLKVGAYDGAGESGVFYKLGTEIMNTRFEFACVGTTPG